MPSSLPMPMQRGFALLMTLALALGAIVPLIAPAPTRAAPTDLFFSEYLEGNGNNRALEIYNGTATAIDLAAGGYNVHMFFDGSAAGGVTINLTGVVGPGDVYVLAQASGVDALTRLADQTDGSSFFGGDDAVLLRRGTDVLDVIGQIGVDPGTEWGTGATSTADNTIRRNALIEAGDTDGTDAFVPASQWHGFPIDTFTGLGSHKAGPPSDDPAVFINEIHYDNTGTDAGEAIEIAGPAGTDLTGWSLVLYNGANGLAYDTDGLSGAIPDQQNGFGTISITYPANGIQNGPPDGIALVDAAGAVVQFLSYEGVLTAVDGPAAGLTSTDIGFSEGETTALGQSLQLTGTGSSYADFTWAAPSASTFGAVNTGQSFGADPQPQVDCGDPVVTALGDEATTTVEASDANGIVTNLEITATVDPNITLDELDPADSIGGTATATVTVGASTAAGTYEVEITATNADSPPQTGTCMLSVTVEDPAATPAGIVISEFRVRGPNGGNDEFIELHNSTSAAIPIGGWQVWGSNATAGISSRATVASGASLEPGCFYLLTNSSTSAGPYSGAVAGDQTYGVGIADTGGLAILDATGAIVDQVGLSAGSAYKEGTPLASLGTTNEDRSYERRPGGAAGHTDTNDNAADFAVITPSNPQNGDSTCIGEAPADEAPEVDSTTPAAGAVNVNEEASISVTFSEAVNVAGGWYEIGCSVSGTHAAAVTGGPVTFTLDPDPAFISGDMCTVTIVAQHVTDIDTNDPPDAMEADHVFGFRVGNICGNPSHFIHQVQGTGLASPIEGQTVTIEGVVVGDHQGDNPGLEGFFVQEEDDDADDVPLTSEGIFVFDGSAAVAVEPGDVVSVTGEVDEFFGLTELTFLDDVTVCGTDASVTPEVVELPVADVDDLERFEGMLVTFEQTLTVTENFGLGRFGELVLSADGRQFQGSHLADTGAPAEAVIDLNMRSRITLDDGDGSQNDDPTRYPSGGLSAENTLRIGATVTELTAVMSYGFDLYRLQPVGDIDFEGAADRPETPPDVGGRIQVAAFNVLNYFNGDGAGDFSDPDNRGAENQLEFDRQRDKIIKAIATMDADVVGLMEIENDDSLTVYAAIEDLVDGLNENLGAGTYDFIETGVIGTDAIAVAIIYQPSEVSPLGTFAILDSDVDERFDDQANRPMLAQTFTETATGASFTVAVNHLKSKGSDCGGAPDDQPDSGGGNCNGTRTSAAEAMVDWLTDDPTGTGDADTIIIGDLNSYAMEDPIDVLKAGGYSDLLWDFQGADEYTYVFEGASGYLDHALSNATMTAQVTGAAAWHINTDEPPVLDYNTNFKSPNHVVTLYAPDAYRSSDHDPVLVGLDLDAPPVITSLEVTEVSSVDEEVTLSATFTDPNADETHTASIDWGDGSSSPGVVDQGTVTATHDYADAGIYTVTLTVTDETGLSGSESFLYAVVFDRTAGFVTGGGQIDTPEDGTASFEFSLKYMRSGDVPSGDISFELPDWLFEATDYDWLVVDGSQAWISGEGTVNGDGGYDFLLAVTDEPDRLRMVIRDDDEVMFDNQPTAADDAVATEPIRNGQIKIHQARGPGASLATRR